MQKYPDLRHNVHTCKLINLTDILGDIWATIDYNSVSNANLSDCNV